MTHDARDRQAGLNALHGVSIHELKELALGRRERHISRKGIGERTAVSASMSSPSVYLVRYGWYLPVVRDPVFLWWRRDRIGPHELGWSTDAASDRTVRRVEVMTGA